MHIPPFARLRPFDSAPAWLMAVLCMLAAAPAAAMYKVVGPDGRITYTDRPPAGTSDRVTAMSRAGAAAAAAPSSSGAANLPADLRAVAARFPVTLYTAPDCQVCDNARQFLGQRGIPHSERRIGSEEDAQELERLVGARTVPTLTVGAQVLRGLSTAEWGSFLDAAGYPRETRTALPPATPTPLLPRANRGPAGAAPADGAGQAAGTMPGSPSPAPAPTSAAAPTEPPSPAPREGLRF
jgi:glutaredoxin